MPKQMPESRELAPFYDTATDPVIFHTHACKALERCIALLAAPDVTLPEARGVNDYAAKIAAIAKIAANTELEVKAAEAKVRAALKMGALCRELPKAQTIRTAKGASLRLPNDGKSKTAALDEAGISSSTAQRCVQLAGGGDPEWQRTAKTVADEYLASCRERQTPASLDGLQSEIDLALPAPAPRKPPTRDDLKLSRVIERPEPRMLPRSARLEPQEVRMIPVYRVPSTYAEGIERAAALLDDMAKERPRPSLQQAAARVRKLREN